MGWRVNVVNSFALTILTSLNKKTTSCNFNKKTTLSENLRNWKKRNEPQILTTRFSPRHPLSSTLRFFEVMAISIALAAMGRTSRTSCRASDGGQHRDIQGPWLSLPGGVFSVVLRGKPRENHRIYWNILD